MAVAKGSKSQSEPKTKQPGAKSASRPAATSGVSKNPMTQGPARLYGDGDPAMAPPPPPKGRVVREGRTPKPAPKAAPKGEANAKPRESVAKGNKTPAVRTTKPKA